eukprot:153756-Rhodomonas_salina.1
MIPCPTPECRPGRVHATWRVQLTSKSRDTSRLFQACQTSFAITFTQCASQPYTSKAVPLAVAVWVLPAPPYA